jgi:excisionase family DNA binding protein
MNEPSDNEKKEKSLELLTIPEASSYLNLTESMLRSLVFKRQIPVLRIGKCLRFSKDDLNKWVNSKKENSNSEEA